MKVQDFHLVLPTQGIGAAPLPMSAKNLPADEKHQFLGSKSEKSETSEPEGREGLSGQKQPFSLNSADTPKKEGPRSAFLCARLMSMGS